MPSPIRVTHGEGESIGAYLAWSAQHFLGIDPLLSIPGVGLLTATPDNQREARARWGCASTVMAEVGLPSAPLADVPARLSSVLSVKNVAPSQRTLWCRL